MLFVWLKNFGEASPKISFQSKKKEKMSARNSENTVHGLGAVGEVSKRFLHPSKLVAEKYPNMRGDQKVCGLVEIRREVKTVWKREQMCIIFRHDDFPNVELHAVQRWVKVTTPAASLFIPEEALTEEDAAAAAASTNAQGVLGDTINHVHQYLHEGFEVDDDTQQNEENLSAETENNGSASYSGWGWDGMDAHKQGGHARSHPSFLQDKNRPIDKDNLLMTIFMTMIPWNYITTVLIPETNKQLATPLTMGEFLKFVGLWLIMATTSGSKRDDFWSQKPISIFVGAPFRLNECMSGRRFRAIIYALRFTAVPPPSFQDRFHPIRELIAAFNKNMEDVFTPGWISCLDESMSIWFNRWSCPGWMFVPRKPHPFGNEYHTLCDGQWGVLYHMELVEGKHRPKELPAPKYSEFGKTVGLVLRCCYSLFSTGKCVIMDSGFCVLDALTRLKSYGVFALIMIKKKKSWPRGVDGDAIKTHMAPKPIGSKDTLNGKHNEQKFNIYCLKEPDYITMLMGTFGSELGAGDNGKVTRTVNDENSNSVSKIAFELTEPFHFYYKYRGVVDAHNARRHSPISLEETWATKTWEHRVFAFVLSVCEVNTFLVAANEYGGKQEEEYLQMRKKLAESLIKNTYDEGIKVNKRARERSFNDEHELVKAPAYATRFLNDTWKFSESERYPQRVCTAPDCQKRIRTHCRCQPGVWLCNMHHGEHKFDLKQA